MGQHRAPEGPVHVAQAGIVATRGFFS
jgi:hypothetical protein